MTPLLTSEQKERSHSVNFSSWAASLCQKSHESIRQDGSSALKVRESLTSPVLGTDRKAPAPNFKAVTCIRLLIPLISSVATTQLIFNFQT